MCSRSE